MCIEIILLLTPLLGVLPDWSVLVTGSALMLTKRTGSVTLSDTTSPGHAVPFPQCVQSSYKVIKDACIMLMFGYWVSVSKPHTSVFNVDFCLYGTYIHCMLQVK